MGVRAADAAAKLAAEHNLPTLNPPAPANIPEFDQFRLYPVSCYEIQRIVIKSQCQLLKSSSLYSFHANTDC